MRGGFRALLEEYTSRASFLCVYVMEAHASDEWPLGGARSPVAQHKTLQDRISAAK